MVLGCHAIFPNVTCNILDFCLRYKWIITCVQKNYRKCLSLQSTHTRYSVSTAREGSMVLLKWPLVSSNRWWASANSFVVWANTSVLIALMMLGYRNKRTNAFFFSFHRSWQFLSVTAPWDVDHQYRSHLQRRVNIIVSHKGKMLLETICIDLCGWR